MAMLAEVAAGRTPVGQPSKFWMTEACSSNGVRKLTFEDHKDAPSKMRNNLGAARINWRKFVCSSHRRGQFGIVDSDLALSISPKLMVGNECQAYGKLT